MSIYIILLIICILFSGFFSSAETALFSISKIKIIHLVKEGRRTDKLIRKMKKESHSLLSTILIGNNMVNIGASSIATALAMEHFKSNAVGISTGIMTFLILVFGEIFPKTLAAHNNIAIARLVIYPLYWLSKLFIPVIVLLNFIPKMLGGFERSPAVTEDELMTMVEVVEERGEIKEEEKIFITNIFEFDDTSASEIMTPRADMYVIDVNQEPDIKEILKSGYSRIPVIEENIDNVVGILTIKDLFLSYIDSCTNSAKAGLTIRAIMGEPYFIPESKKLDSLLHAFKRMKKHIGIVIDEHGGVSGIVTLEDVLEEIVGEIVDETDTFESNIVKLKDDKWVVLGKTEIDELNETLELGIPDSSDYDTFSGYILDKIGRIPKAGESVNLGKYMATVKEKDGNRIKTFIFKKV